MIPGSCQANIECNPNDETCRRLALLAVAYDGGGGGGEEHTNVTLELTVCYSYHVATEAELLEASCAYFEQQFRHCLMPTI